MPLAVVVEVVDDNYFVGVDDVLPNLRIMNSFFTTTPRLACQATADGGGVKKSSAPVLLRLNTPISFTSQRHTMQTFSHFDFYWASRPRLGSIWKSHQGRFERHLIGRKAGGRRHQRQNENLAGAFSRGAPTSAHK